LEQPTTSSSAEFFSLNRNPKKINARNTKQETQQQKTITTTPSPPTLSTPNKREEKRSGDTIPGIVQKSNYREDNQQHKGKGSKQQAAISDIEEQYTQTNTKQRHMLVARKQTRTGSSSSSRTTNCIRL
jgi:hypothetical protein